MRVDLSVVVPTHDTIDLTLRCLDTLTAASAAARPTSVEIVLVDDASGDGTGEEVARAHPGVRVLRLDRPSGFTRAANAGLAAASGDLLWLLNSDTEVDPGAITAIARAFAADARLGIAGAALRSPSGEASWSGGRAPSAPWLFALASGIAAALSGLPGYRRWKPVGATPGARVDWVPGTALAMRRAVWAEVGPLDTGFRLYAQDADLCLRARDRGWRIAILDDARVVHHEGSTVARVARDVVARQRPALLWDDLARLVERRDGARAGRRARAALALGATLRLACRRAIAPLVPRARRPGWSADTRTLRDARAALARPRDGATDPEQSGDTSP